MVFGKTFSGAATLLAVYSGKLPTLQSPFLLRLPGGGAAFVAAKGVGAQMAERLLTLGWRGGLELLPALLLLRCAVLLVAPGGFSTLLLGRRTVVTAVITALGGLLQLRRGRLTLGVA